MEDRGNIPNLKLLQVDSFCAVESMIPLNDCGHSLLLESKPLIDAVGAFTSFLQVSVVHLASVIAIIITEAISSLSEH